MLKKNVLLFSFTLMISVIVFQRITKSKMSVSTYKENGHSKHIFSSSFNCYTTLNFKCEKPPEFIDITLSNNRIIRYCSFQCSSQVNFWKDLSGRTRVWPVILINCKLKNEGRLRIGKDFLQYGGSHIDTLHIISVSIDGENSEVSLSKSFFSFKKSSSHSNLTLKNVFPLQKIDMPASIEDGHVQTWEYIAISPDGNLCGVSSFDGNVYTINTHTGKTVWKYNIHDGKLSTICYSNDGKLLLAGEHSTDGFIYCFDALNGDLLWKYRTADDIGSLENTLLIGGRWGGIVKPNAREIIAGTDNLIYARAYRSRYYDANGKRVKETIYRLYCIDAVSGSKKWTFPNDSNLINVSSSVIHISQDGRFLSWVYFDYDKKINPFIIVFDAVSGKILWSYQTDTVEKFFSSSTGYSGLSFSFDGSFAAIPLNDGRVFIFDNKLSVKLHAPVLYNVLNMTPPIDAGTIPVMTHIVNLSFTNNGDILILTGNTYTTPFASTKIPPVYHPHANSVFCFSKDGNLKWRFTFGGNPSDLFLSSGPKGEFLVLPCAHNIRSKDLNEHGFYLFNNTISGGSFSRLMNFYHTNGICVNACLSHNQKQLFIIEAPIDMDESIKEKLEGKHRILFFDLE